MAATTATLVGASATPFVAASLQEARGSVPQWTLFASHFVTLTSLLRTRPLLEPPPSTTDTTTMLVTEGGDDVVVSQWSITVAEVVASPLMGVSQLLVVPSLLSGAIIREGIGVSSPLLAVAYTPSVAAPWVRWSVP